MSFVRKIKRDWEHCVIGKTGHQAKLLIGIDEAVDAGDHDVFILARPVFEKIGSENAFFDIFARIKSAAASRVVEALDVVVLSTRCTAVASLCLTRTGKRYAQT